MSNTYSWCLTCVCNHMILQIRGKNAMPCCKPDLPVSGSGTSGLGTEAGAWSASISTNAAPLKLTPGKHAGRLQERAANSMCKLQPGRAICCLAVKTNVEKGGDENRSADLGLPSKLQVTTYIGVAGFLPVYKACQNILLLCTGLGSAAGLMIASCRCSGPQYHPELTLAAGYGTSYRPPAGDG